jgi:single-stranded DNA-binding protein
VRRTGTSPTIRAPYTQSGAGLAGFTVAVSHRSKHNGEWQDVNDGFFRCTAWRSVAENAIRTLKKGMRIFVSGKLGLATHWHPATQEEIAEAMENPGQSGSSRLADLHK